MKNKSVSELGIAIAGIRVGIVAIIIALCVEIISLSLPNISWITPNFISSVYLVMAVILIYMAWKIKIPKKK